MIGAPVGGALTAAVLVALLEPEVPSELDLRWDVPAERCPGAEEVQARVEDVLGRPLASADGAPLVAQATVVKHNDQRYELTIETRTGDAESTRTFSGSSCAVLVDAAALIVASALDPNYGFGEPEPESESESDPESESESDPDPESESESDPDPESDSDSEPEPGPGPQRRLGGAVRVGAVGQLGLLPGPSIGLDAALALRLEHVRVEARFASAFARTAGSTTTAGTGAQVGLWAVGLRGCWTPRVGIVEFPLCGGVEAGRMTGDGYGVDRPTTTRIPWVAGDVGVAIAVSPWPFLSFWLGPDLVIPITRPAFSLGNERLHRVSSVGGSLVLGVEGRFGAFWPAQSD